MKYLQTIQAAHDAAEQLEQIYRDARRNREASEFIADMLACYKEFPENMLYAAWYQRVQHRAQKDQTGRKRVNWRLAVLFGLLAGVILALLPIEDRFMGLLWAPIIAGCVIAFLACAAKRHYRRTLLAGASLLSMCIYSLLVTRITTPATQSHYLNLMEVHMPLLAWAGVGMSVLGRGSSPQNRSAFLIKSFEVFVVILVCIFATVFVLQYIYPMFYPLIPMLYLFRPQLLDSRLVILGGLGFFTVLVVASIYAPSVSPISQDFRRSLSKLIATTMRRLLLFILVILALYLCTAPFNFMEPFQSRRSLIASNTMLFAVMGGLVAATPARADDLSLKYQTMLRTTILAIAVLSMVINLYVLSACIYRAAATGITANQFTTIGWNCINIGILVLLIYKQFRYGRSVWLESLHSTLSAGATAYVTWTLFLSLAIPVLFPHG